MKLAVVLFALVAMVASEGVNVVENSNSAGVNVVDNSGGNPFPNNPDGFVIDEAFYQPGVSNGGAPISVEPAYVDESYPPKKYNDPMLRGDKN